MKESIGGLALIGLVISLIVLFTGIVTFTVNRSNSFAIKDEIISIIESDGGFDMHATYDYDNNTGDATLGKIVETLSAHQYRQTGICPDPCSGNQDCTSQNDAEVACYTRTGKNVSEGDEATIVILKKNGSQGKPNGTTEPYYFEVRVFYRIDLPVLNNILIFSVRGQTKPMYTGATDTV